MTQCRCDPEVVTVHLFTLATMVFVLQLIVNTITIKISAGFFRFPSNSKEFKKWEHLSRLNSLTYTNVIANVNKKATNRTVSFDKWAMCHLTAVQKNLWWTINLKLQHKKDVWSKQEYSWRTQSVRFRDYWQPINRSHLSHLYHPVTQTYVD